MMAEKQNKAVTALVTGGTRRVGLEICRVLARAGVGRILITSREPASAEALGAKKELESLGAWVSVEKLALEDLSSIGAFGAKLAQEIGSLDVLVHNASVYDPSPLGSITADQLEKQMRINAFAPALLTQGLRSALERSEQPGGAGVVAMADMHATGRPRKDLLAYNTSKAALVEIVRSLARELAPKVRVNAIAPGVIDWPETGQEAGSAFQAEYLKRVPLARAGTPTDAAEAVRWLALDAHYTTGEILRVDGGRWLA